MQGGAIAWPDLTDINSFLKLSSIVLLSESFINARYIAAKCSNHPTKFQIKIPHSNHFQSTFEVKPKI